MKAQAEVWASTPIASTTQRRPEPCSVVAAMRGPYAAVPGNENLLSLCGHVDQADLVPVGVGERDLACAVALRDSRSTGDAPPRQLGDRGVEVGHQQRDQRVARAPLVVDDVEP